MDVFSLGCVIAELFLEGQQLFNLSQLLGFRTGEYDPKLLLQQYAFLLFAHCKHPPFFFAGLRTSKSAT